MPNVQYCWCDKLRQSSPAKLSGLETAFLRGSLRDLVHISLMAVEPSDRSQRFAKLNIKGHKAPIWLLGSS